MLINSYVLKIASRCNLNCSYCYMYNLGDRTYLKQPKLMSIETIENLAIKIREYSNSNKINEIEIIFHGGEPLLQSKIFLERAVHIFNRECSQIKIFYKIQTNGVLLLQDWIETLKKLKISIGVSFDGPKKHHDNFRKFHNGKGSYDIIKENILNNKFNISSLLSVVNTEIDANIFYEEVKSMGIQKLNLLLPDSTHDSLPKEYMNNKLTPFADWLIEVFVIWINDEERPNVLLFRILIDLIIGNGSNGNQSFGKISNSVIIIETDGGIEVADSLKSCYEGITKMNLNINSNKLEDVFDTKIFDIYYNCYEIQSNKCLNCPIIEFCGGGALVNRYSKENGFNNPTIYCNDIIKIYSFIRNKIIDVFRDFSDNNLDKIQVDEIYNQIYKGKKVISPEAKEKLEYFKLN